MLIYNKWLEWVISQSMSVLFRSIFVWGPYMCAPLPSTLTLRTGLRKNITLFARCVVSWLRSWVWSGSCIVGIRASIVIETRSDFIIEIIWHWAIKSVINYIPPTPIYIYLNKSHRSCKPLLTTTISTAAHPLSDRLVMRCGSHLAWSGNSNFISGTVYIDFGMVSSYPTAQMCVRTRYFLTNQTGGIVHCPLSSQLEGRLGTFSLSP